MSDKTVQFKPRGMSKDIGPYSNRKSDLIFCK